MAFTNIDSWTQRDRIYHDDAFEIVRIQDPEQNRTVLIKRAPGGSAQLNNRLHYEARLLESLKHPNLIRCLQFTTQGQTAVLILEDPGGVSLKDTLVAGALSLDKFFRYALQLAELLCVIHERGIIHKGINAHGLFITADGSRVLPLNFSSASRQITTSREFDFSGHRLQLLPYISPEQTGRMNRTVDHRSDIYSVGIIFYEMLIGAAPFTQDDPFEILHSHIAREASPPENLRPDVPIALARIIRKCIAKDTVDRYQTAVGLREDLKFCLAHLSSPNEISAFQPGKFDTPDRFHLSQKIYGRAEQLQLLNQCFERVQNACTELVTVLAGSGLGKSALIGEIFKSFAARRGRTASGKYEQFERQVPYRGWLQICGQLIDEVLKENDTGIQRWRERILRVLGGNGHILIKVLPALERILGSQAEVPELPPGESRNRFIRIFSRFIRVFASNERPLVIFLDDVQWADIASVELIQSLLLDPESQNILLIIAYRDSEVTRAHSVHDLLMTLRKQNVNITTVELEPLSPEQISQLIADSFFCAPEEARPLAELVHARTLGNPFFINQFLTGLHRDGHLNFHARHARWVWNFSEISHLRMTDNVVEYMKQRLSSLSEETRRVMARAAALGTRFERHHLETILNQNFVELQHALEEAVNEGFLLEEAATGIQSISYCFVHDHIRAAAYELLQSNERASVHLHAGQYLLQRTVRPEDGDSLFEILQHLNQADDIVSEVVLRRKFARLNLMAARQARLSAAVRAGLEYASTGIRFLDESSWQACYDLAFELHLEAIQSLYLTARYQEAEALFVTVHKRARSPLDQARLYTICVVMYTNMGRHREAIRMGIHGLRHLRYGLSEDPGVIRILANVLRLRMRRRGKSIEEIAHLPRMQDPRLLAIMDLLMAIVPSAFFIHQNLFALIVLRMVRLSVQFGNVNESAYGYLTYGVLLIAAFQNIDRARAYSKVAMRLMESSGPTGLECRMHVVYGSFINHWIDNIKYNSKYLRKAFREGLESGDNVYAGYALANRIFASVVKDDTLDEQDRLARTFLRFTDRTGDRDVENDFLLVLQANRNLRGLTHVTDSFNDSEYDEHTHINEMRDGNPVTLCWFYLLKMQNLYILGHYAQAWQAVQTLSKIIEPAQALVIGPEFIFFRGLIAARLAENQIRTGIWQMSGFFFRRCLRKSIRQYEKWARYSPATFGHKLELLKAEHYRLIGRDRPAIAAYSEACRLAGLRNALRVRAIASERAGQYYSEQTAEDLAVGYLRGAYRDYLSWGALLKAEQLETQYNRYNLTAHISHAQSYTTDSSSTGNAEQSGPQKLDVAAIAMSARALSREIVLDRLLARLMEILLLQSGGRRGFFIRNNGTEYRVEAGGDMERNPRITIESRPLENHPDLPVSVVQYVINTNESLVLVNAGESLFKDDAYIKSRRIRSLLCMPVMLHGKPSGILYLENNLTAGTFTPDRLEVLSILSAQAAVSLENALMYAGLEQQVAERTQEVQHTLEKVQNLKVQQDSDYYLTSLLVQPLARISVTNERIQVRGLVHQKKQFQYKKWSEQIGGDVCIARDITLQDRDCVVFISADAMGKSLQGAGGVLVLGSVFESIISGVGAYEEIARLAPAEWLRRSHLELNSVFNSFSGYMMVSALLGLIEAKTGIFHFINCDHPGTVLYRNRRAAFMDEDITHKLGVYWLPIQSTLSSIQLEKGDLIITGSDGRDDLLVTNENGPDEINDDADDFLRRVERADGDIQIIFEDLIASGQLTDDLSLLSVQFE